MPTVVAAAAWSMRARTAMPRLVTAAASRSIVSFGPWRLAQVISPSGIMTSLAQRMRRSASSVDSFWIFMACSSLRTEARARRCRRNLRGYESARRGTPAAQISFCADVTFLGCAKD
jgi:hypothetical protein